MHQIWERHAAGDDLDVVATIADAVVGHVLGSWGAVAGEPVIGVAPLAVAPPHQRNGVGSAVMRDLIATADAAGLPMLVLLGDPAYYGRFGFEPSGRLGVWYEPAGIGNPDVQVRRLGAYRTGPAGAYVYSWELPG